MSKKVDLILCLSLGYLGIHKFYEKKIGIGILYLFTVGLFAIGWIYDCMKLGIEICNKKTTTTNNSPLEPSSTTIEELKPIITSTLNDINIVENKVTDKIETTSTNIKISKRDALSNSMNPSPIWNEGTEAQQEFATDLVDNFCNRFAKYLCWGIKDHIITSNDADDITDSIYISINAIDDAKWWCNKKNTNDFTIVSKLLENDEVSLNNVKKLKKEYN